MYVCISFANICLYKYLFLFSSFRTAKVVLLLLAIIKFVVYGQTTAGLHSIQAQRIHIRNIHTRRVNLNKSYWYLCVQRLKRLCSPVCRLKKKTYILTFLHAYVCYVVHVNSDNTPSTPSQNASKNTSVHL